MEATPVKTGKRMEQALDKQAQALIQTVKIARTEAFEAELSELNGKFRTNKPFMFQIAAISKNESLVQLFDGTWDKEGAPLENLMSPSPQQPSSSNFGKRSPNGSMWWRNNHNWCRCWSMPACPSVSKVC